MKMEADWIFCYESVLVRLTTIVRILLFSRAPFRYSSHLILSPSLEPHPHSIHPTKNIFLTGSPHFFFVRLYHVTPTHLSLDCTKAVLPTQAQWPGASKEWCLQKVVLKLERRSRGNVLMISGVLGKEMELAGYLWPRGRTRPRPTQLLKPKGRVVLQHCNRLLWLHVALFHSEVRFDLHITASMWRLLWVEWPLQQNSCRHWLNFC